MFAGCFNAAAAVSRSLLLPVALVAALTACAPPRQEVQKRFFWPTGVDDPKVEYVGWFVSEEELHRGDSDWFEEVILGKKRSQRVFSNPMAIAATADGRVLVSDTDLNRVLVFDLRQKELRQLQERSARQVREFTARVMGLAAMSDGSILAAIASPAELVLFGRDETVLRRFGAEYVKHPLGMAVDETRRRVYVADSGKHAVLIFTTEGEYVAAWGKRGSAAADFNFPLDVAVDGEGRVYVLDSLNAQVKVFSAEGAFLRAFGERGTALGSFTIPKSLAVSPQGHVYVTDSMANKVVMFDGDGRFLMSFGGRHVALEGVAPGGFNLPAGIDVGADSAIWVIDSMNRMFHQFQYLTPDYLEKHPILPGEAYRRQ